MKDFLETTIGKILLFIIVIGVWGVNFFNFSDLLKPEEEIVNRDIREISLVDLVLPTSSTYKYQASPRDPFNPNKKNIPSPVRKEIIKPEEQPFRRPQLSLTGIIGNIAVITDARGESYFVAKGDSLLNSYVLEIIRDSVILSSRNNQFVITLKSTEQ